jgi:gamma-glutamyltranspeptidase/glutathione hydrolase
MGFGSGVTVPGWGINLQNRGAYVSLDPDHVNVIAPRKRTLHTLIPAMALREGRPWLVFGTMGGDGQAQTHLQLLVGLVDDGLDPQQAVSAPRWTVSPGDWSVAIESRFDRRVVEGLKTKGHRVVEADGFDSMMGHAHVIELTDQGHAGGSDPRAEGAVLGL